MDCLRAEVSSCFITLSKELCILEYSSHFKHHSSLDHSFHQHLLFSDVVDVFDEPGDVCGSSSAISSPDLSCAHDKLMNGSVTNLFNL